MSPRSGGDDSAVALAVLAVGLGSAGIMADVPLLTVAAWLLLLGALAAIVADDTTPEMALASCAVGVVVVGAGATIAGYLTGSDAIVYGGLVIVVVAFVVALAEMWGSA